MIFLQNGNLQFTKEINVANKNLFADNFLDSLHVGKIPTVEEKDSIGAGAYYNQKSQPQQITDFNLWNRSLALTEMMAWTSCK